MNSPRILLLAALLTGSVVAAHADSFYPRDCRPGLDCTPVEYPHVAVPTGGGALELIVSSKYGKTVVPQSYTAGKSKDGRVRVAQADVSRTVSTSEGEAIHKVISDYYNAFGRDSAAAAEFYGEPTLIVLPNQVIMLNKRADVEAFLAKIVATLKPLGYSGSKLEAPRIKLLNVTTALYSTVAVRLKTDGTEMQRAGFTYLLQKSSSGWKIHQIIATDVDKLISAN